jgi:hypothetical protein
MSLTLKRKKWLPRFGWRRRTALGATSLQILLEALLERVESSDS